MTNRELASFACAVASKASSWANDCLTLPEKINEEVPGDAAERFAKMLRDFASHVEKYDD